MQPGDEVQIDPFFKQVVDACTADMGLCTIPFFGVQDDIPTQCGTGVMLQIAEQHFIRSADHVADIATIHNIPFYAAPAVQNEVAIPMNDVVVTTSAIPEGVDPKDPDMRKKDPFDVCVMKLPKTIVEKLLLGRRFIRLQDIDVADEILTGLYVVIGYPYKYTKTDVDNLGIFAEPLRYMTEVTVPEGPPETRMIELEMEFPEWNIGPDGEWGQIVHPGGMSGCGIWRLVNL